jgi:hypothetical protein
MPKNKKVAVTMKIDASAHKVHLAQTQLQIKIYKYWDDRDCDIVEQLRALTFEIREILLDMEPKVHRSDRFSNLKDLIKEHQKEHELTDIEVLQVLFEHGRVDLERMRRFERHGSYDTPAMQEKS